MASIKLLTDERVFESSTADGSYVLKISPDDQNGLSFNENKIRADKGPKGSSGSGGISNTPGNGISGVPNESVYIIRCNSTVSRRVNNDDPGYEGVNMQNLINSMLGR